MDMDTLCSMLFNNGIKPTFSKPQLALYYLIKCDVYLIQLYMYQYSLLQLVLHSAYKKYENIHKQILPLILRTSHTNLTPRATNSYNLDNTEMCSNKAMQKLTRQRLLAENLSKSRIMSDNCEIITKCWNYVTPDIDFFLQTHSCCSFRRHAYWYLKCMLEQDVSLRARVMWVCDIITSLTNMWANHLNYN